ncbi:MAG: site-2 protease family protein [Bacilli bacterium]
MKLKFHYSLASIAFIFAFSGLYLEILLFFSVILLHELGHIIFLKLFKQKICTFNISIVGGILDVEYKDLSIIKEMIISLAGVIVNCILLIFLKYLDSFYYQDILIKYNLLFIVFNLLPIYPLDGYRFLEALLKIKNDPFSEQKILNVISIFSLLITLVGSIIYFKTLSIIIVFGFLGYHNLILHTKYTEFVLKKYVRRYKYKRVSI